MEKALLRLNETTPIAMEFFGSTPETPTELSLRKVAESTVYVGVFAHRYGTVPEGATLSITEQEYRKAREEGIPVLIYLSGIERGETLGKNIEEDAGTVRTAVTIERRVAQKSCGLLFYKS